MKPTITVTYILTDVIFYLSLGYLISKTGFGYDIELGLILYFLILMVIRGVLLYEADN